MNEVSEICMDCNGYYHLGWNKEKENKIRDVLICAQMPIILADRIIPEGCSKYRPDFVIQKDNKILIVEVDEHQHRDRAAECEHNRMVNIIHDIGGPVTFIRYNPDDYYDDRGVRRPAKDLGRQRKLLEVIKFVLEAERWFDGLIVCKLFYDGFDGNPRFARMGIRPDEYELLTL
jgi:hypothetical protein